MAGRNVFVLTSALTLFVVVGVVTFGVLRFRNVSSIQRYARPRADQVATLPSLPFPQVAGTASPTQNSEAAGGWKQWFGSGRPQEDEMAAVRVAATLQEACSQYSTTVREAAAKVNYCDSDMDCTSQVHTACALGCEFFYNTAADIAPLLAAVQTYEANGCKDCPKICIQHNAKSIACINHVCGLRM